VSDINEETQVDSDSSPISRPRSRTVQLSEVVFLYVVCVSAALIVSALLVSVTGGSWRAVFAALLDGSVRNPGRWGTTIGVFTPLLLVAVGTIVNVKAGLVNIGQEGQLLIGGAFAAFALIHLDAPGPLLLAVSILVGIVAGALWAGIAAGLRYWRNVPEVLTSLLLVLVASQVVGYGFRFDSLLLEPLSEGRSLQVQQTPLVPDGARLERVTIFSNEFPISAFAAVAAAAVIAVLVTHTVWGLRIRALGRNPRAAHRAGVAAARYGLGSMLISGALAGLAGTFMLTGGDFGAYRFSPGFAVNIGWTGLLVALVSRGRALFAIPLAFVFASLRTGSGFLAATGVERRITDVVQALLVLALLIPAAILFIRQRRRAAAATEART
jgi:simple sugar transport system permease protein